MSNPLEDYLHQFRAQLKGLPEDERAAEVEETRQHLLALAQERIEQGQSEEAALTAAIHQFGTPHETARALRHARNQGADSGVVGQFIKVIHTLLVCVMAGITLVYLFRASAPYDFWSRPRSPFFELLNSSWTTLGGPRALGALNPVGLSYSAPMGIYLSAMTLGVLSFAFPRALRTTFLGIFTLLISFHFLLDASEDSFYISYRPEHLVTYPLQTLMILLGGFALTASLARDRSFVSRPRQYRTSKPT